MRFSSKIMKILYSLALLGLSAFVGSAQDSGKTVQLIGTVAVDRGLAILEVQQANHNPKELILAEGQVEDGIEMLKIDSDKGVASVKINGESRALALEKPDSASGTNNASEFPRQSLRLQQVELQKIISLYSDFKGRTVLQHPELPQTRFSLVANPKTKREAAEAFEKLFATQNIATIPDGTHFVMLVPNSATNRVTPRSDEFANERPMLPSFSMNFQGVPLPLVVQVYSEYINRPLKERPDQQWPGGQSSLVNLTQQNPLSKRQICYAMNTVLAWHGIDFITNQDGTLSWERLDHP